jgi:hypothetical protein
MLIRGTRLLMGVIIAGLIVISGVCLTMNGTVIMVDLLQLLL